LQGQGMIICQKSVKDVATKNCLFY
jgi:hypothetical protein